MSTVHPAPAIAVEPRPLTDDGARLVTFLRRVGLERYASSVPGRTLPSVVEEEFSLQQENFAPQQIQSLYLYRVPKMRGGVGCTEYVVTQTVEGQRTITMELDKKLYNLAETYGLPYETELLRDHPMTLRLWRLRHVVQELQRVTGADWVGVYRRMRNRKGEDVLLKESYVGIFSRAEFPLTREFARHSNNSTVGMTGKAVVVADVGEHVESGKPYYPCDVDVLSEFCCPILSQGGDVVGIVDAESFARDFFTPEKILQIAKVCLDLGSDDPTFVDLPSAAPPLPASPNEGVSLPTAAEKLRWHAQAYRSLTEVLRSERNATAKMATISAVLKAVIPNSLWVGFYCVDPEDSGQLVVGPYQGSVGCLRIGVHEGVCGMCARERRSIIVPDVSAFPGHIYCDMRSRSEITVPVLDGKGKLIAVFDIDSDQLGAFDEIDREWLERIVREQFSA